MSRKELYRRTKGCVFHGIADFVVWIILTLATAAIGITENPAQIQIILALLLLSDLVASVVLFLAYWKYWLDLIQKATLVFNGEVVSGGPIIGSPIETRSNWRLTEKGTDTMRQFLIYLPEMEKQYHKTTLIQDICYGPVSFLYLKRSKYIVEIKSLSAPEQNKLSKHAQKKKRRRVNEQGFEAVLQDTSGDNAQVWESLNWENEMSRKSSIFKNAVRKILLRCNQRGILPIGRPSQKVAKTEQQAQIFPAGFSLPIATGLSSNHSPKP